MKQMCIVIDDVIAVVCMRGERAADEMDVGERAARLEGF